MLDTSGPRLTAAALRSAFTLLTASATESTGGAKALQPQITTWMSSLVLLAAIIKGLDDYFATELEF
ncbi:hypothetical protein CRM22_009766 [Opisthorchis felineus]|uniref:Uncharacterized protein n=1 Tax=Opisthorchis felineus TaxID=147828 RepID=A0A4S2LCU6_OPIFE|nr:hypothetical protein CRM22_009766 [Opisthorchis felineus]